ncbi:kinesin light chain 1, partial [Apiospora aurea]
MRLLVQTAAGDIHLEDFFSNAKLPPYAILSHTWGSEEASSAEVQESITCMFRWYRGSEKCYVYLADVSGYGFGTGDGKSPNQPAWELTFRKSRWFTRGWTLQELLAPASSLIEDITGIPADALRGRPLSDFSILQRLAWVNGRNTTRSEDKAYSLLGLFDIQIPLLYGEGQANAMRRLREEIHKAESRVSPLRRNRCRQAVTYVDYDICFLESCSRYLEYPNSLLFNASSRSKVRDLYRTIHDPETKNKIFDAKANHCLTFLELKEGENDMCVESVKSLDGVKRHLHGSQDIVKDPKFRYVSIDGWSPHLPLNCSFEMFAYLYSYHQIPESVLDHVFAFRSTDGPQGIARTGFHSDDTLSVPDKEEMAVPSANRSANAIRLSYLLSVAERSEPNQSSCWVLRQLAVYHSFDVINGGAFRMTIKANATTRENIHDEYANDKRSSSPRNMPTSFSNTLTMQLLLLEASCDNWCWHLEELEQSLHKLTRKAQIAYLDTNVAGYQKSFCNYESQPIPNRWNEKQGSAIGGRSRTGCLSQPQVYDPSPEGIRPQDQNFKGWLIDTIEKGHLALEMNLTSLQDIKQYYQHILVFEAMPGEIRRQSTTEFALFLRKVDKLGADLDRRKKQWETLEKLARDGKSLYHEILQYSDRFRRIHSESSRVLAQNLESIASKTEEGTAAMHITTLITIFFLPGTFLLVRLPAPSTVKLMTYYLISLAQSILQGGIFRWSEPLGEEDAIWIFKWGPFGLSAAITLVSIFVTFLMWFFMFRHAKGRPGRHFYDI